MEQSRISRALRGPAGRQRSAAILAEEKFESRSALGRRICREFPFADPAGRLQLADCMKALSSLAEADPGISLPPPKAAAVNGSPRLLKVGVPVPEGAPEHPSLIRDLSVEPTAERVLRPL